MLPLSMPLTLSFAVSDAFGPRSLLVNQTDHPAPTEYNPYAREKRKAAGHRLYPSLIERLNAVSRELNDRGYEGVSAADVTNAILHAGIPRDVTEAEQLIASWRSLLAKPPPPQTSRPDGH